MAQVVEYALVLAASSIMMAGSLQLFGDYRTAAAPVQMREEFLLIQSIAESAIQNGSAAGEFRLPNSTISCHAGILSFSSSGSTFHTDTGSPCDFAAVGVAGLRTLVFKESLSGLTLEVK